MKNTSNWALVNPQRVTEGKHTFLPNLFFLFNFDEQVQVSVNFTWVVEIHKLLLPMLTPSQKCSETPEFGMHYLLLPSKARKASSVIPLLKSSHRNLCTTLPGTL